MLQYVGTVVVDGECSGQSDYTMRLQPGLAIDAEHMGNEARFINDYRGVAKRPNVALQEARDRRGNPAMAVVALRPVGKGEELLLSYGKGFWQARRGAQPGEDARDEQSEEA